MIMEAHFWRHRSCSADGKRAGLSRARGGAHRSVVPLVNPKDLTVSRYEHTCGPPTLDAHVTASEAAVLTQGLIVP